MLWPGLGGRTAIIGVELNKLGEIVKKPAEAMSRKERWAVYFGYYKDPGKQGLLRKIEELEEGIGMAETVVKGFTQHELEVLREISLHKRQMDYQEDMIEMQQEARAEGRAEGLAEGRTEGRLEGRAEGQRQLLDLLESGKSLEEAKRILGLA